jgi:ribosomal protein S18 acetylase RimI-like enzyme
MQVPVAQRNNYRQLLILGDEDPRMLDKYIDKGKMFVAKDQTVTIGVLIIVPVSVEILEIKNIAVKEKFQSRGVGSFLISYVEKKFANKYKSIQVGTGDADLSNIRFYLKNGYRFSAIREKFFEQYDQPIFANGIQLQDMVVLSKNLQKK